MGQHIDVSVHEGGAVRLLTLGGSKGNILSMALMTELNGVLETHREDLDLKLVVLRGAGGRFSFGASVEEHRREQAAGMLKAFHYCIRNVASYPVPVLALVEKQCLGGAFELALVCHVVFATQDAVFACPEIKLGVYPPVLAAAGAQRLGGATMERLALTGGELKAEAAHGLGWVAELLAADVDPWEGVMAWFQANLAGLSAYVLRQATQAVREAGGLLEALGKPLDRAERRYVQHLVPSHDGNEGIEAFLARRKPEWKHR